MLLATLVDAILGSKNTHGLLCAIGEAAVSVGPPDGKGDDEVWTRVVEQAKKVIREGKPSISPTHSGQLSGAQRQGLADAIRHLGKNQTAIAAEALFSACDEALGARLWPSFEKERHIELKLGSPFPIAYHDLKQVYGDVTLTSRPPSRDPPFRKRKHIDIFSGSIKLRVKFEFAQQGLLRPFLRQKTLGLVFPNSTDTEIDIKSIGNDTFFDVAPKDHHKQQRIITAALVQAAHHRATVVLLPELCVTPQLAQIIAAEMKRLKQLSLVLAGSYHARDGNRGVNRMEIHARCCTGPLTHDKLTQFELKSWNGVDYERPLREDIDPSNLITVRWSGGWSCVTLICKDFLDKSVRGVLEDLRPNFIFVVAFSDSTADFDSNVRSMATNCQATVVLCNFVPRSTANPSATIVLPVDRDGQAYSIVKTAGEVQGKLVIFQLRSTDNPCDFKTIDIC